MTLKQAKLVGIDHYPHPYGLASCIADATALASALEHHEDGERLNFECELVISSARQPIDSKRLKAAIDDLFADSAECVFFYFAGHASLDLGSSTGCFVTVSQYGELEELPFDYLLKKANEARSKKAIINTVIVLDCCNAGSFAEISSPGTPHAASLIGNGVTVLAATSRAQAAREGSGTGGLFTQYMVDGLRGSAADLRGRVTPASLYAHIDQMLGRNQPRPVYKANVQNFIPLRECSAPIDVKVLRALPRLFPDADAPHPLSPKHEPNRDNTPKELEKIEPDPAKVEIFKQLQALNRQGLVVPIDADHMYYAAIESKACRLTELGKHYRELALLKRI